MSNREPSARLFVLLARTAPVGVIFRRGPSKQVLMIRWNTSDDTFEEGQWLKGRVYERRCDLSPSGDKLIYFAASFKPPLFSWTAVSKPPYFRALALWPKGDCWNGGGRFLTAKRIALNHPPDQLARQPGTYLKDLCVTESAESLGEDDTVYEPLLKRDGWELITRGRWQQKPGKRFILRASPPEMFQKKHPAVAFILEMSLIGIHSETPQSATYQIEYRILDRAHQIKQELGLLDWAEWDRRGDLVYTKHGRLFRQQISERESCAPVQIADFRTRTFQEVKAPPWATTW